MASTKTMDRLVCGDVGFGKTNKLPKQKAKTEEKARRLKEQAKNIKRKKERRLQKEREDMEAKRLADKYKIKLIANKKYGVPLDFEP